jgi:hypothetical protein
VENRVSVGESILILSRGDTVEVSGSSWNNFVKQFHVDLAIVFIIYLNTEENPDVKCKITKNSLSDLSTLISVVAVGLVSAPA